MGKKYTEPEEPEATIVKRHRSIKLEGCKITLGDLRRFVAETVSDGYASSALIDVMDWSRSGFSAFADRKKEISVSEDS
jgi:hypothetical protein